MTEPTFPPLMRGLASPRPFERACAEATRGCDPGLVVHDVSRDLDAALVLAPEVALEDAMAMLPACGLGLVAALGALGPSEMAVEVEWMGGVRVNGAGCGRIRAAASTSEPEAVPDWLVVGLETPWWLDVDAPGLAPDRTALAEEGCGDLTPCRLLESWSRHTLVWIDRWQDEGARPLHEAWRGLVVGIGGAVTAELDGVPITGAFLGLDERFGMILRSEAGMRTVALSSRLEAPASAFAPDGSGARGSVPTAQDAPSPRPAPVPKGGFAP